MRSILSDTVCDDVCVDHCTANLSPFDAKTLQTFIRSLSRCSKAAQNTPDAYHASYAEPPFCLLFGKYIKNLENHEKCDDNEARSDFITAETAENPLLVREAPTCSNVYTKQMKEARREVYDALRAKFPYLSCRSVGWDSLMKVVPNIQSILKTPVIVFPNSSNEMLDGWIGADGITDVASATIEEPFFDEIYLEHLVPLQITVKDECFDKLFPDAAKDGKARRQRKKVEQPRWPKGQPPHLHFVLYKENRDTAEVIDRIASLIRCSPDVFSWAGKCFIYSFIIVRIP